MNIFNLLLAQLITMMFIQLAI